MDVIRRLFVSFLSLTPLRRGLLVAALAGVGLLGAATLRTTPVAEAPKGEPERPDDGFSRLLQTPQDRQRDREREIAEAIRAMEPVANASVKFVSTDKIFRNGPDAVASVLVEVRPGSAFTRSHARAVAELICGAVPGMKVANVKVVDTKGRLYRLEAENDASDLRDQEAEYAAWLEDQVGKLFPQWRRAAHVRLTHAMVSMPPTGAEVSLSVVIPDDAPGVPRDPALREAFVQDAVAQIRTATGLETASISVQLMPIPKLEARPATASLVPLWPLGVIALLAVAVMVVKSRRKPAPPLARESVEPFGFLQGVSLDRAVMLLKEEHAQAVALVLAHLPPVRAGEVLEKLPSKQQVDVIKRLSSLDGATPEAVAQVEHALEGKLAIIRARQTQKSGGPRTAAEILSQMRRETESQLMVAMMENDPDLVARIRSASESI